MIVLPMAGKSSRFYAYGYKVPKFMLPLLSNSNVFREAVKSFEFYFNTDTFLFITRSDDGSASFVKKECNNLRIKNVQIISLDSPTRGQAETVAMGLKKATLDLGEPLYIFNIDSIRVNFKKPQEEYLNGIKGYLEVFKGEGEHWSFVESGCNDLVVRTTEKNKISDLCSNGLYYFSSCELFLSIFEELKIINEYPEFFIAPMYNILISNGHKIRYKLLTNEQTLFAGTPTEYEELKKIYDR